MAYLDNILFQKEYFPDIFFSYGERRTGGSETDKLQHYSASDAYVYVYFVENKTDVTMTEAYNEIFAEKLEDGRYEIIKLSAGYMEQSVKAGNKAEVTLFSPFVRDAFYWHLTNRLDRAIVKKAMAIVIVGDVGQDFFKKRELESIMAEGGLPPDNILRVADIAELKRIFLKFNPIYSIRWRTSAEPEAHSGAESVTGGIPIELRLSDVIENGSGDMYARIIDFILNEYREQGCKSVLRNYLENGAFSENYIEVERFFKHFKEAQRRFAAYVRGTLLDKIESINKRHSTLMEKHNAIISSKEITKVDELIARELVELRRKLEDKL